MLGKVSRVGTLDSVDSAVSLVQMLFLYFRILGKVILKVQPSPDAGGSATRWAQQWVELLAVGMYHFKVFWKRKHPLSGKHRQVYCSYFSTWVLSSVLVSRGGLNDGYQKKTPSASECNVIKNKSL